MSSSLTEDDLNQSDRALASMGQIGLGWQTTRLKIKNRISRVRLQRVFDRTQFASAAHPAVSGINATLNGVGLLGH